MDGDDREHRGSGREWELTGQLDGKDRKRDGLFCESWPLAEGEGEGGLRRWGAVDGLAGAVAMLTGRARKSLSLSSRGSNFTHVEKAFGR